MARTYDKLVTVDRINALSVPEVKEGMLGFITAIKDVSNARWRGAHALKLAYDNKDKETVFDPVKKTTKSKFDTDKKFFEFLGFGQVDGCVLVKAVEYSQNTGLTVASKNEDGSFIYDNDGNIVSEFLTLEDLGFSTTKVYDLCRGVGDDWEEFKTYALTVMKEVDIRSLSALSDKGLRNLIEAWKEVKEADDSAIDTTATVTDSKQDDSKQDDSKTDKIVKVFKLMKDMDLGLCDLASYVREHDGLTIRYDKKQGFVLSAK